VTADGDRQGTMVWPMMRTLIVDDEPAARKRMRRLLEAFPDIDVVGESGDGTAAVDAIRADAPDLVVLDVQMPGIDGFAVLQQLAPDEIPAIVFVTDPAADAVRALDLHALDYVVTPIEIEPFAKAIARGRSRVHERQTSPLDPRIVGLLRELSEGNG
jgi:two-component system LytT family response regulator